MSHSAKPMTADAAPESCPISGWVWAGLTAGFLVLAFLATPIAVLLIAGLCPTFLAALADRRSGHVRTWVMALMNTAGCWPFVLELWTRGASFDAGQAMMKNPFTWLGMYGAAAAALFLLWAGPVIAAGFVTLRRKRLAGELAARRSALQKEWGLGVANRETAADD